MAAASSRPIMRAPLRRYLWFIDHTSGRAIVAFGTTAASISKDGESFDATGASVQEIAGSGVGYVELDATETTLDSDRTHLLLKATNDTSDARDFIDLIEFEPCMDSGVAQGGTEGTVEGGGTITLAATASALDDFYNGAVVEVVRGTGAGQMRVIRDYDGTTKVASTDRLWLSAGTVPDNTSVYIVHPRRRPAHRGGGLIYTNLTHMGSASSYAEVPTNAAAFFNLVYSTINDGSPTTGSFVGASTLSATDDFYTDLAIGFTSGPCQGVWRKISDYNGTGRLIYLDSPLPATPTNGDAFMIAAHVQG